MGMAYLAKQRKGKGVYYYLVENIRSVGGRRKQMRRYIGASKPTEGGLKLLLADFEKDVQEERSHLHGFHYLTSSEIDDVGRINGAFSARYRKAGKTVQEQFDQNFVMAFVYNTNSIEGSTLTPKEVELLLGENIAPRKPLEDVLEARAAERALKFARAAKDRFDQDFILKLHRMYFRDTKPGIAGRYKIAQNRVMGSSFETTPPEMVITDMKLYFKEYAKLRKELHPLELAAWCHWKLVRIHPFQDGNGRIARVVMNYVLRKNGYAMIDIKTKERQRYFDALERCNYQNSARALAVRLVRRFKKQYERALL
jgi:Fic family protein